MREIELLFWMVACFVGIPAFVYWWVVTGNGSQYYNSSHHETSKDLKKIKTTVQYDRIDRLTDKTLEHTKKK
jgi:hypothetical protein